MIPVQNSEHEIGDDLKKGVDITILELDDTDDIHLEELKLNDVAEITVEEIRIDSGRFSFSVMQPMQDMY